MNKRYNHYGMTENVYNFCKNYFKEYGYAPTNQEIADGVGLCKSSVNAHMKKLFKDGTFETNHPGYPRAFRIVK